MVSDGVGVSKAKIFKGKYEVKLECLEGRGRGSKVKKPPVREVWIFSATTHPGMIMMIIQILNICTVLL